MGNWWNIRARRYVVTDEEYENRCRWEDLTLDEKGLVCDGGCGITIFGRKFVPDILFLEACCKHDFASLRGGDERVRLLEEAEFRAALDHAVEHSLDPVFFGWCAKKYYGVTGALGMFNWRYGPMRNKAEILGLADFLA